MKLIIDSPARQISGQEYLTTGLDFDVADKQPMSSERARTAYDDLQQILGSCSDSEHARLTNLFLVGRSANPAPVNRNKTGR